MGRRSRFTGSSRSSSSSSSSGRHYSSGSGSSGSSHQKTTTKTATSAPSHPARPNYPPATQNAQRPYSNSTAPATAPHPQNTQPQHVAPPAQAPASSGGPGIMGQIAATAAGTAVGSFVGHSVSRAIFGGGGAAAPVMASNGEEQGEGGARQDSNMEPCGWQSRDFINCLEQNNQNISVCQSFFDMLSQCRAGFGGGNRVGAGAPPQQSSFSGDNFERNDDDY